MDDDAIDEETSSKEVKPDDNSIVCPVCGAATAREKCKVIGQSDLCRGRVIYNCAEF
jgi:hypothetical protein